MNRKPSDTREFEVVSGELIISDPCYTPGTWCTSKIRAANGKWAAQVYFSDEGDWGMRVAALEVWAVNGLISSPVVTKDLNELGVDSGQLGIFDASHFRDDSVAIGFERHFDDKIREDEPWYSLCCDRTLSDNWDVIPFGVVTRSGFGDGGYDGEAFLNQDGEAVRILVTFIDEETDEDEEDDSKEWEDFTDDEVDDWCDKDQTLKD